MTKDEALEKKAENARELGLDYEPAQEYERGFIDGMQKQMQSSVDKAVNAMSQRTWVGLTDGEVLDVLVSVDEETVRLPSMVGIFARAIEAKLKEKNT